MWWLKQKNILKTFGWYFTVHVWSIADTPTCDQAIVLSKTAGIQAYLVDNRDVT